jgi:hypothetical protein
MSDFDEQRVAEALAMLPPAPEAWVSAARELPRARAELDDLVRRIESDRELREQALADVDAAVRAAGQEPSAVVRAAVRARLIGPQGP